MVDWGRNTTAVCLKAEDEGRRKDWQATALITPSTNVPNRGDLGRPQGENLLIYQYRKLMHTLLDEVIKPIERYIYVRSIFRTLMPV